MIIDRISECGRYVGTSKTLDKALKILAETDLTKLQPGRNDVADGIYFNVFEADAKALAPDSKWETHKDYIDIHVMISGCEKIYFRHVDEMTETVPYDASCDATFFVSDGEGGGSAVLNAGDFALCLPEDAHLPLIQVNGAAHIKKAVMKVRID